MNKEIHIAQGTEEWKEFRKLKIGASDSPIILGISPFCTPLQLYNQKSGLEEMKVSFAMQKGSDLESEARESIESLNNKKYRPAVFQSLVHDFLICSLDGISEDGEIIEIKCPGENTVRDAFDGKIPEYYRIQVQHQMYVMGCKEAKIYVYNKSIPDLPLLKEFLIERDESVIQQIMKKGKEFYDGLINFEPPAPTDKDFIEKTDNEWKDACEKWRRAKDKIEEIEIEEEKYRNILINLSDKKSCIGFGVKTTPYFRKGNVDYSKIPELSSVNLEKYRKKGNNQWRVFSI